MPGRRYPSEGDPNLKNAARRHCLRIVKARRADCYRCNRPIDYTLTTGRWRWVGDEIIPRYQGGRADDPNNVVASHLYCNAAAGARITNAIRRQQKAQRWKPISVNTW